MTQAHTPLWRLDFLDDYSQGVWVFSVAQANQVVWATDMLMALAVIANSLLCVFEHFTFNQTWVSCIDSLAVRPG